MIRFAADENLNDAITRGLRRRQPAIDIVRVQDAGLSGADDPTILQWAAEEGRVLLTHDVSTTTKYAYERLRNGQPMPGVFEVVRTSPIAGVGQSSGFMMPIVPAATSVTKYAAVVQSRQSHSPPVRHAPITTIHTTLLTKSV